MREAYKQGAKVVAIKDLELAGGWRVEAGCDGVVIDDNGGSFLYIKFSVLPFKELVFLDEIEELKGTAQDE